MQEDLLQLSLDELKERLLQSTDSQEMNDLVSLFNLNLRKREIIRADVFSELQDSIATQMSKRLEKNQDTFSNKDLLDYLNSIQSILNKYDRQEDKLPTIAIQNNLVINQSAGELDKDSRDRITDVIRNILKDQGEEKVNDELEGEQIIDVTETSEHEQ